MEVGIRVLNSIYMLSKQYGNLSKWKLYCKNLAHLFKPDPPPSSQSPLYFFYFSFLISYVIITNQNANYELGIAKMGTFLKLNFH